MAVSALPWLGMTASVGFLSMAGIMAFGGIGGVTALALGVTALFSASLIEGEIYLQTVVDGIFKAFQPGYRERTVLLKQFYKLLEAEHSATWMQECTLFQDYLDRCRYLTFMSHRKDLTKEDRRGIKLFRERKEFLEKYIVGFMQDAKNNIMTTQELHDKYLNNKYFMIKGEAVHEKHLSQEEKVKPFPSLFSKSDLYSFGTQKQTAQWNKINKNRERWMNFFWVVNVAAGVSYGFSTAISIHLTFLQFGWHLGAIAAGSTIWGLAALAAVGYMYLMYHTFQDIVLQERMTEWKNKFKNAIQKKVVNGRKETNGKRFKRLFLPAIVTCIVMGLLLVMTIGTGGAWWKLTGDGVALMHIANVAVKVIQGLTVPFDLIGTTIFNAANGLETAEAFSKYSFKRWRRAIGKKIRISTKPLFKAKNAREIVRLLNPFHLLALTISELFELTVLVAHCASMGLIANDSFMPANVVTAMSAGSEAATDLPYIAKMEMDDGESYTPLEHATTQEILPENIDDSISVSSSGYVSENEEDKQKLLSSPKSSLSLIQMKKDAPLPSLSTHSHDHNHIGVIPSVAKLIFLTPIFVVSAIWANVTKKSKEDSYEGIFSKKGKVAQRIAWSFRSYIKCLYPYYAAFLREKLTKEEAAPEHENIKRKWDFGSFDSKLTEKVQADKKEEILLLCDKHLLRLNPGKYSKNAVSKSNAASILTQVDEYAPPEALTKALSEANKPQETLEKPIVSTVAPKIDKKVTSFKKEAAICVIKDNLLNNHIPTFVYKKNSADKTVTTFDAYYEDSTNTLKTHRKPQFWQDPEGSARSGEEIINTLCEYATLHTCASRSPN